MQIFLVPIVVAGLAALTFCAAISLKSEKIRLLAARIFSAMCFTFSSKSLSFYLDQAKLYSILQNESLTVEQYQECSKILLKHEDHFFAKLQKLPAAPKTSAFKVLLNIPPLEKKTKCERNFHARAEQYFKDAHRNGSCSIKIGNSEWLNQEHVLKDLIEGYIDHLIVNPGQLQIALSQLDKHPLNNDETKTFVRENQRITLATSTGRQLFSFDIINILNEKKNKIPTKDFSDFEEVVPIKVLELLFHIHQGMLVPLLLAISLRVQSDKHVIPSEALTYEYHIAENFQAIDVKIIGKSTPENGGMYNPINFTKTMKVTDFSLLGDDDTGTNDMSSPYEISFRPDIPLDEASGLLTKMSQETDPNICPQGTSKIVAGDLDRLRLKLAEKKQTSLRNITTVQQEIFAAASSS